VLRIEVLNLVQQFLQWLVQQYHKMLKTFSGVVLLLLQSCYCCFGSGAGQGSITAASQTATAALVAGQVDGVLKSSL
jgi:hypothetical protein